MAFRLQELIKTAHLTRERSRVLRIVEGASAHTFSHSKGLAKDNTEASPHASGISHSLSFCLLMHSGEGPPKSN